MLLLVGCASDPISDAEFPEPASDSQQAATTADVDTVEQDLQPVTDLTAELLYDVLLASIAAQRQQPDVALEALSRAVYASHDKRLNATAIQLALRLKDFQKAIELARLMLADEPQNYRVILSLASAQMESEKIEDATDTLVQLGRDQKPGNESVMQEIAALIARQGEGTREEVSHRFLEAAKEDHPSLVFTSALLAARLNQDEEFRKRLDKTLELNPAWEVAAILKLTDLADNEDASSKMDAWAMSFLQRYPDSEQFRVQFARLLIRGNEFDRALSELDIVIKQNPESKDALFTSAVVNMDQKEYERAKSLFTRYIEASNNGDQARLYLAEILIEEERYDKASPLLRQIQSRQYYLDAQIALSGVIARQSNVDAGLNYLRNIDALGEEDSVRLILEQDSLLRDFDQEDRSLELLTDALEERPEQPDLLYSRGLLAAQLNKIELIEQDMRRLIEIQPENAHAYNALGYTLADQTERYDEALELISKALEYRPDDPFILDSMGWVHYRIGNNDKAISYLERALELKQDAEIAAHLGEVLWITGKRTEAEIIWNQGMEWGPENAVLLKTIDKFLESQGDQQSALHQDDTLLQTRTIEFRVPPRASMFA
ncbi:MAG: tetratricopeptide repeat protein [Arenicellales bacterium]